MEWSEAFATGIPMLDEQHRMLFRMARDYRSALDDGHGERVYGLLLESLREYARAHFGIEEQCMFRHQCPAATENAEAHVQFLRSLGSFTDRFATGGFTREDARDLVDTLDDWLATHIGRIDVQLRACVGLGGENP